MKVPNIKTKVVHSTSINAWKVVGDTFGKKYKIAIVPYIVSTDSDVTEQQKQEAFEHATFISFCFNNSEALCKISLT
jgi:hypothetical protein